MSLRKMTMITNAEFLMEHFIRFYNTLKPIYKFDLTKQLMSSMKTDVLIDIVKLKPNQNQVRKVILTMANDMLTERLNQMGVNPN